MDRREAENNQAQLIARRDYLRDELKRQQVLVNKGFVSEASLSKLVFDLKQAEASVQAAIRPLAETALRSTIKGVVLRQDGEAGEMVSSGQVLFWVGEPKNLRVSAEVDEEDILRVQPGLRAFLKADGLPGLSLQGVVSEVTEKGDPLNKSYRVRVGLPEGTPLKTGMTVEVNVVVEERPNAVLVPNGSLRDNRLWVVESSDSAQTASSTTVARLIPIKMGVRGQEQTEILGEGNIVTGKQIGRAHV